MTQTAQPSLPAGLVPDPLFQSNWRPALLAAALGALLYAITLGGTYIYDDVFIAHDDVRLHGEGRWREYLTQPYFPEAPDRVWRPLVSLSYAAQWAIHGNRPWALHLVNVLLHAGVCALTAELARRLAGTQVAYVAGLLFAAHPIHVEAVAGIVGRAELACALASLGALALFVRRPMTLMRAVGIAACLVVAILSKEQGLLVPMMLLGWALLRRPRQMLSPQEKQATQWLVLLLCFMVSGYIVYRELTLRFTVSLERIEWVINPMVRAEGLDRWLVPIAMLGRYVALLVAPLKLSPEYGATVIGWTTGASDPYLWAGLGVCLLWVGFFVWGVLRRRPAVAFCLLCAGLGWGMVSNLASIVGINFAERLMYLPSAFFLILLAIAGVRLLPRRALAVLMIVALALFSLRTMTYAARWNDRLDFYRASLEDQPRSAQLAVLTADEYLLRGDLVQASEYARRAREIAPEYWWAWVRSGLIAEARNELPDAAAYLQRAFDLWPDVRVRRQLDRIQRQLAATRATATPPATPQRQE